MANISKIKLPDVNSPYDIADKTVRSNVENNTYKFLTYKDNMYTEAQIKALTSAKVGDFYIASDTGAAWICVTAINSTASASSWEKAGSSADVSAFVTAVDAGAITDTVPQTFEGHQISEFVLKTDVVDNLTSTATDVPLSAAQGKALNDSVNAIQDDISALTDNKLNKSGGTMTGILTAQANTNYATAQVRNVIISPNDPSGGNNGDIWIKYVE